MDQNDLFQLIDRYLKGTCSPDEKALVERFYMEKSINTELPDDLSNFQPLKDEMLKSILKKINQIGDKNKED